MKKLILYLLLSFIVSYGSYSITILIIPNIIYKVFHYKIVNNQNVKDNELKHFHIPNDQSRDVVMPNPDFLYSTSFYDLSNGDINLKGKMPDSTYWSVSFYKPNTVNWFVKNDNEFIDNNLDMKITLSNSGQENSIVSPVKKGFMIIRILVEKKDSTSIGYYKELQKSITLN